jgi:hypothetical protein
MSLCETFDTILVLFNEDKVFWGNMCEAISCGLEFVLVHEIQYLCNFNKCNSGLSCSYFCFVQRVSIVPHKLMLYFIPKLRMKIR